MRFDDLKREQITLCDYWDLKAEKDGCFSCLKNQQINEEVFWGSSNLCVLTTFWSSRNTRIFFKEAMEKVIGTKWSSEIACEFSAHPREGHPVYLSSQEVFWAGSEVKLEESQWPRLHSGIADHCWRKDPALPAPCPSGLVWLCEVTYRGARSGERMAHSKHTVT